MIFEGYSVIYVTLTDLPYDAQNQNKSPEYFTYN